jgi:hypothetical protein
MRCHQHKALKKPHKDEKKKEKKNRSPTAYPCRAATPHTAFLK